MVQRSSPAFIVRLWHWVGSSAVWDDYMQQAGLPVTRQGIAAAVGSGLQASIQPWHAQGCPEGHAPGACIPPHSSSDSLDNTTTACVLQHVLSRKSVGPPVPHAHTAPHLHTLSL